MDPNNDNVYSRDDLEDDLDISLENPGIPSISVGICISNVGKPVAKNLERASKAKDAKKWRSNYLEV